MYIQADIYLSLFFIYSFLGWCLEVCWSFILLKRFINRGFLLGPFCPIYGFAVTFITLIVHSSKSFIYVLFVVLVISATLEYLTSFLMEKIFSARWWDYSRYKFNLNGRICLETLLPFAFIGSICVKFLNPTLIYILSQFPANKIYAIILIFSFIMLLDFILSSSLISNLKKASDSIKDNTEEISQKVRERIQKDLYHYKRIFESFPSLEKRYNIKNVLMEEYKKAKNSLKGKIQVKK